LLWKIAAAVPDGSRRTVVMGEDTPMNELAIAQHFVLYAALIVAVAVTLEWFETRRTRARAPRRRHHDRPRSR
jgi:hypothetical protein